MYGEYISLTLREDSCPWRAGEGTSDVWGLAGGWGGWVSLAQAYSLPGINSSPSRTCLFYGDTVFSMFLASHVPGPPRKKLVGRQGARVQCHMETSLKGIQ